MRRSNSRGVPRPLSTWAVAASLFSFSCVASDHLSEPSRLATSRLTQREEKFEYPNEHVVLADCSQGDKRHLTSQMAYYYDAPNEKPVDVALVDTQPGQFALWINSNTTALFTDSNIYFTATLGPIVKDGAYAGYGHNGAEGKLIHNFNCWRKYEFNLYEWQNVRCSMTYYCNHDPRPDNAPDIVITTNVVPSSTATLAPGESAAVPAGNGTLPGTQDTATTGLSHGALIGAIVGSVAVLVIGGLLGLWLLLRRRSRNKDKKDSDHPEGLAEADDGRPYGDKKSSDAHGRQELDAKLSRFEMDTEAHRFEMANNEVAELDGTGLVFDRKDSNDLKHHYDINDVKPHHDGDYKHHYDTKASADIKQREVGDKGDSDAMFDEPKTMLPDELKARAVDKAVIRASTGAGSATVSRWTEKKENEQHRTDEQQSGDEVPLRAPPTRSETNWSAWTTDSEVDLAGFPLVLMSPMSPVSPLSPSGPKPPND
ncbi:hypothetical protein V8F06_007101 [Rhypophila decipiens]